MKEKTYIYILNFDFQCRTIIMWNYFLQNIMSLTQKIKNQLSTIPKAEFIFVQIILNTFHDIIFEINIKFFL